MITKQRLQLQPSHLFKGKGSQAKGFLLLGSVFLSDNRCFSRYLLPPPDCEGG